MAKKTNFRDTINQFADSIKNKPSDTPIQEVRPVEPLPADGPKKTKDAHPGETHVNFWGDDALIRRLKVHAAQHGMTIKDVCSEALEAYLNAREK